MIYLDNAATSMPKPRIVPRAVEAAIERFGNPGRSGHRAALEAGQAMYECREEFCGLFNVTDPFRFVFCFSCTDALNQAIKGMCSEGGHVVTTALEHNSVLRPVHTMKERSIVSVSIVYPQANGYIAPTDIGREITPRTKLVIVNHASNVTGAVQPISDIAELCYRKKVPLLVDGAQSAGIIPVDLSQPGIDLFAFPSHKGLLGPQGAGALYIRESCAPLPLREGGTGSSSLVLTQPLDMPDRYESGTPPTPAIAGMLAGTNYVRQHFKEIHTVENHMTEVLWEGLKGINGVILYGPPPGERRVGVITFNLKDMDSSAVADALWADYGIACRAGLHCAPLAHMYLGTEKRGAIRFSVGPFTTLDEVHQAVKVVYKISKKGLS